jgi:hypothetical protein
MSGITASTAVRPAACGDPLRGRLYRLALAAIDHGTRPADAPSGDLRCAVCGASGRDATLWRKSPRTTEGVCAPQHAITAKRPGVGGQGRAAFNEGNLVVASDAWSVVVTPVTPGPQAGSMPGVRVVPRTPGASRSLFRRLLDDPPPTPFLVATGAKQARHRLVETVDPREILVCDAEGGVDAVRADRLRLLAGLVAEHGYGAVRDAAALRAALVGGGMDDRQATRFAKLPPEVRRLATAADAGRSLPAPEDPLWRWSAALADATAG